MKYRDLETRLREVVSLAYPYPFRSLQVGTPASVLVLAALRKTAGPQEIELLITRRGENLDTHKGQYAFPGGVQDPEDGVVGDSNTVVRTALREAKEEVGVPETEISPIGTLPPLWTPTGFQVTPVLGLLRSPLEEVNIRPNPDEIDIWFWCALSRFRAPEVHRVEDRLVTLEGRSRMVPMDVFQVDEHRIWGATAAILKNFIGRWEKLG